MIRKMAGYLQIGRYLNVRRLWKDERGALAAIVGLAIIPMFGAMPIGEWAAKRVSKAAFDKLILALLAVIALRLSYGAIF